MTVHLSLLILLGVFVTSFLSGILGMAGGMVLMGLLAWVLPVQQAMTLHAVAQFFANGSRALIHNQHLHTSSIRFYLGGLALSFALFSLVAFVPGKSAVFLLLGVLPFIPLLLRNRIKPDFTRPGQAFFCGAAVTCLQLTAGVAGPLLDIFFQKIDMTRHQVVATKAFTQSASHIAKLIYFGAVVRQAPDAPHLPLWIYLAVIPLAITGSHAAKFILDRMSDRQFYNWTQRLLWSIGAIYIARAILLSVQ